MSIDLERIKATMSNEWVDMTTPAVAKGAVSLLIAEVERLRGENEALQVKLFDVTGRAGTLFDALSQCQKVKSVEPQQDDKLDAAAMVGIDARQQRIDDAQRYHSDASNAALLLCALVLIAGDKKDIDDDVKTGDIAKAGYGFADAMRVERERRLK